MHFCKIRSLQSIGIVISCSLCTIEKYFRELVCILSFLQVTLYMYCIYYIYIYFLYMLKRFWKNVEVGVSIKFISRQMEFPDFTPSSWSPGIYRAFVFEFRRFNLLHASCAKRCAQTLWVYRRKYTYKHNIPIGGRFFYHIGCFCVKKFIKLHYLSLLRPRDNRLWIIE